MACVKVNGKSIRIQSNDESVLIEQLQQLVPNISFKDVQIFLETKRRNRRLNEELNLGGKNS